METVRKAKFQVIFAGKDITSDISKNLVSITYTDKTENESDEINITLEDTDGNWRDPWYPVKGDKIQLKFGYEDTALVDGGTFEIDEIEASGPPDIFTIRGIAAGIKKAVRTKNSKGFEGRTLKQIAEEVAGKNGLTLETGDSAGSTLSNLNAVKFTRVTQNRETDLGFLKRIGSDFGFLFSVRDTKLIFTSLFDIEKGEPVVALDRTDLMTYSMKDKTSNTFKKAKVRYHDPTDKTVKEYEQGDNLNADGSAYTDPTAEDTLEIRTKAENTQHAELKAKTALYRANSKQKEGSLTIPGNPLVLAGSNIELTGMGAFSGKYHVTESTHNMDASGSYQTSVNLKLVGYIDKVKNKSTKPRKPNYHYEVVG